jgi:hypothetical protein
MTSRFHSNIVSNCNLQGSPGRYILDDAEYKATGAPETSVKNIQSTWCHISDNCNVEAWKCFHSVTER